MNSATEGVAEAAYSPSAPGRGEVPNLGEGGSLPNIPSGPELLGDERGSVWRAIHPPWDWPP